MAIVNTIDSAYELEREFKRFGRENNFTYQGLKLLFDYLEEYSDSTGEPVELDVVSLCCEYSEDSIEDIIDNYCIDVPDADGNEDEIKEIVREYLNDNTIVCGETSGGFVYAVF